MPQRILIGPSKNRLFSTAPDPFLADALGMLPSETSVLDVGGSEWPHRLMERMGVDLTNLDFWKEGLGEVEALIDRAESLAESVSTPAHVK